jgi:hypothetical protein
LQSFPVQGVNFDFTDFGSVVLFDAFFELCGDRAHKSPGEFSE